MLDFIIVLFTSDMTFFMLGVGILMLVISIIVNASSNVWNGDRGDITGPTDATRKRQK